MQSIRIIACFKNADYRVTHTRCSADSDDENKRDILAHLLCVCVCVCVCADSDDDDEKDMVAQMRKMNRKLITLHQDNVEMRALDVRCTRSLIV